MTDSPERVDAVVDAMLGDRRPAALSASREEAAALRAAALLSSSRPGASDPDPGFVEALAGRLHAAVASAPEPLAAAPTSEGLPRTDRRRFLRAAGLAAAAAAAGVLGDRVVERLRPSDQTESAPAAEELVPASASWQDVAALADVRSAGPRRFRAGAVEGVVALAADGGVIAVSAICTHLGCALDVAGADLLRCPCHGAEFHVDGTPGRYSRSVSPLPTIRSRVVGDRVQVLV